MALLFTLVLLVVLVAVAAITLHKVRAVHRASFQLLEHAETTRRETEALYAQLQATASLQHLLSLAAPLPPMRGWAGSPDFLLHLADHLLTHKSNGVLECSSGVSTVVSARCMQLNGSGHVWSLKHEPEFAEKTRSLLKRYGLSEWATVLDAPLTADNTGTRWYQDSVLPRDLPPIGVLVVDGPPQSTGPLARSPAFFRLKSRLAPGARVFVDDADRPDERAMVERWKQAEPGLRVGRPYAEKGLAVVVLPG